MSFALQNSHKVVSLFAAVAVTLALHGSLLAGFGHLANQSPTPVLANCGAVTLPTVTVAGGRG